MTIDRRNFITSGILAAFASAIDRSEALAAGGKRLSEDPRTHAAHPKSEIMKMGFGDPRRKGSFRPLGYSARDELSVAEGFTWYPLLKTGDVINSKGDRAGDCCDFLHFVRGQTAGQAFLWVNHEYLLDNVLYGKIQALPRKVKNKLTRK